MSRREFVGRWLEKDGRVVGDAVCEEIERLTTEVWVEIGQRDGGWVTLYHDPSTGEYWERTYSESELHGGGPPRLRELSESEVRQLYGSSLQDE